MAEPTNEHAEDPTVAKICPHCGAEYETSARFCPRDGTALRPTSSDSLVGHTLADRYHIVQRIGEGGMGRVYLAEHVKMNRRCAVKVMSPALLNDAESSARFAREASNAARIIHPNVAAVFDYGESDGLVYLVMELVDGEPLSRIITREAPLAIDRALDLTRQIADGLGAAHELGIVHRDLKPDNILVMKSVSGREVAKVVDFGIAKAMQDTPKDALTRTGHVVGTPEFMSPEQLLGDPVDARSDLYALGCILHLMLTSAAPLSAVTREQMIKRRLSEDAAPVDSLNPLIPASVSHVVTKLLARSPRDRYASAADVHTAVTGIQVAPGGAPQRAPLVNRFTPRSAPTVAFLQATGKDVAVTIVPKSTPLRRAPLVAGGVLIAAVVLGWWWLKPISNPMPPAVARDTTMPATPASESISLRNDAAAATAVVPMLDTVAENARHVRDSVAKGAAAQTTALRAPIARYARAIEAGNIMALKLAYPLMTEKQEQNWERNVFARADHISAPVRYGAMQARGDSANVEFSLALSYADKATKQNMSTTLRQHAKLVRRSGAWMITDLQ